MALALLRLQTANAFSLISVRNGNGMLQNGMLHTDAPAKTYAAMSGTIESSTFTSTLILKSSKNDSWDYDENYDDDDDKKKNLSSFDGTPNLGINIGSQLDPLTPEQAQELKDEATETINAAFDARIDEITNLKKQVQKDFEKSRESMKYASDLRAAQQTDKLMNKIDQLSDDFLSKNEELRMGTKLAAQADRNMVGKGLEVGSWGKLSGSGMNVLTASSGGMSAGLLGSVSAAQIDASSPSTESSIEVDTQVVGEEENRIMIICDEKQVRACVSYLFRVVFSS